MTLVLFAAAIKINYTQNWDWQLQSYPTNVKQEGGNQKWNKHLCHGQKQSLVGNQEAKLLLRAGESLISPILPMNPASGLLPVQAVGAPDGANVCVSTLVPNGIDACQQTGFQGQSCPFVSLCIVSRKKA